ncbi:MAG: RNA methyltransferase, partial [Actinobacteria bacterium]|nr:RNA methyltransferase [Actinomycetota bacterium]
MDPAHQRGRPHQWVELQPVDRRAPHRRGRGRPQDPRRARGERAQGVRRSRRSGEEVAREGVLTDITSPRNPRVARARKLRRRSSRDREGAFLAEGPQAVLEALDTGSPIEEVFLSDEATSEIESRARAAGVKVIHVADEVLASLADTSTPQGVVAVVEIRSLDLAALP